MRQQARRWFGFGSAAILCPWRQRILEVNCLVIFVLLLLISINRPAFANDYGLSVHNVFSKCYGSCFYTLGVGKFLDTKLTSAFGVEGYEPPWKWQFEDSGIFTASISRPLVKWSDLASIDPEIGIAQRFGKAQSQEIWAAFNLRWHWFPWDNYVDTTIGVTTGINYAFKNDKLEDDRDLSATFSHFLHFFSPEISFKIPRFSNTEFVVRLHHRSGGRDYILGPVFGSTTAGGAQYLTLGIRQYF